MMTNRDWLCLAIRLFGLWLLIRAVEEIFIYSSIFVSAIIGFADFQTPVSVIVWLTVRTTLASILVLFAPAIATRFYPTEQTKETNGPKFDEPSALKIGIQLLALYALLLAVQSGSNVVFARFDASSLFGLKQAGSFNYLEGSYLRSLLNCGLNLTFAAILIMWNDRVITFIEKFRYVAERDAYEPPPLED